MITKMEVFSANPSAPVLPLAGSLASTDPVQIRDVDGLGPVKAEITSTPYATGRGELYQGGSTGKRNIVLTLGLNPDWEVQTIASLRQLLYAYFLPEAWVKLRFYSDYLSTVDIEGYVESFEPNIFSQDPEMQISIICPKPDFVDINATVVTGVVSDGSDESVFTYIGTVKTGFEVKVEKNDTVPTYTGNLVIVNKAPILPQSFTVGPVTVDESSYFKLTTVQSQKRAQSIDTADGTITNQLAKMTALSVWPELAPGDNAFSVVATTPGQSWTLAYFNRFGGL